MSQPFLKWAGGKRKLLPDILPLFPDRYGRFHDLFLGGGAVLLAMKPGGRCANDVNPELINTYRIVQSQPEALLEKLAKFENNEVFYYAMREMDRDHGLKNLSALQRAARFIYLNKTAFNGLYRENKKGEMNVSYGFYKRPDIVNEKGILTASKALQDVTFSCGSYAKRLAHIDKGDLVYLDPPYLPVSKTSNFAQYSKGGFDLKAHRQLADFCDALTDKGVSWILSHGEHEFYRGRFKQYAIHEIKAARSINRDGGKRGKVTELVISHLA